MMVELDEYVWTAIEKDIVAVHYNKVIITFSQYDQNMIVMAELLIEKISKK